MSNENCKQNVIFGMEEPDPSYPGRRNHWEMVCCVVCQQKVTHFANWESTAKISGRGRWTCGLPSVGSGDVLEDDNWLTYFLTEWNVDGKCVVGVEGFQIHAKKSPIP